MNILTKEFLEEQFIHQCKSMSLIAQETNIEENVIKARLRKYGIRRSDYNSTGRRFRFPIDESKVDPNNPEMCYLAGLVVTDGHIYKDGSGRIHVSVANEGSFEVLDSIRKYFNSKCAIKKVNTPLMKSKGAKIQNSLHLYSDMLIKSLNTTFNIPIGDKSLSLGIPDISELSEQCKLMYLRGVIDGDGSIGNYGALAIEMGSEKFVRFLKELIFEVSGEETSVKMVKGKYWWLYLSKVPTNNLMKKVYQGHEEFRFPDKYNKWFNTTS